MQNIDDCWSSVGEEQGKNWSVKEGEIVYDWLTKVDDWEPDELKLNRVERKRS